MPDIHIHSMYIMGHLRMLGTSSNIWNCPPRQDELCGWPPVCPTDGIGYSWTIFSIHKSCSLPCTFTALHICEELGHGVVHINGQGIPPSIIQKKEKNIAHAEQLRGTTKAAMLHNSNNCPQLFAVLVYNTKPVHILSTAADCVEWIMKERKVWSDIKQMKTMMKYLCLNLIEDYNNHMNWTDIADQLRGNYQPDRWM